MLEDEQTYDLNDFNCRSVDVSSGAAYLMAAKEENELSIIKKACQISVDLFNKYLKEQVMEIVDADKKVMN